MLFLLIFPCFGFKFRGGEPISIFKDLKSKIKVQVNYREGPNQSDFFTNTDFRKFEIIEPIKSLDGTWFGTYDLSEDSVYWINPHLDSSEIFKIIEFGPYDVYLKFKFDEDNKLSALELKQEDIDYGSVSIELANNKQINYWTKATTFNWLEIVRGKLSRINNNELFTIFQTTIYEDKIPIYAFRGEFVLKRTDL